MTKEIKEEIFQASCRYAYKTYAPKMKQDRRDVAREGFMAGVEYALQILKEYSNE